MRRIDRAVSVFTIIFLVLLLLKICGLFDIPWVVVVMPLWVPTAAVTVLALIAKVTKLIVSFGRKRKKQ